MGTLDNRSSYEVQNMEQWVHNVKHGTMYILDLFSVKLIHQTADYAALEVTMESLCGCYRLYGCYGYPAAMARGQTTCLLCF